MTNELIHYGIPGMKWGKRKVKAISTTIKKIWGTNDNEHNFYKKTMLKRTATLSDDDLKRAINRMNLEMQYKNLKKGKQKETQEFISELSKMRNTYSTLRKTAGYLY